VGETVKLLQQNRARRAALFCGAAIALAMSTTPALAQNQVASISIRSQPMATALQELARQSGANLLYSLDTVKGLTAPSVQTQTTPESAARLLLAGTDLSVVKDSTGSLIIQRADSPQSGSAAGNGAEVEALIVTAQKREEDIQDVPIAMSAFTQEALERSQVAGGPDLMTQVPNMTFTKTNFTGYSIQIRGIGTQAISATTDAAVAVAFNNTPFIRNRFFEQEFYDLQRVEVLRGPQGTLYGRNATAGVVNIISQKPKFTYEAKLSGDVANYNSTRLEGMVNVPLVDDKVAMRLAGAWTKREGYATNQLTGNPIDGRDLWSTRLSLRFAPTERLDANLIWEHFEENDDRLRSGKQLCHTHEVTEVAGFPTTHYQLLTDAGFATLVSGVQATFSQGCLPTSLYAPESFETPNGISLPYYIPLGAIGLPTALDDPYVSRMQSRDLRVIESTVDPQYKAKSDLAEVQVSWDISDRLTLASETAWASDFTFSSQDFNRFNTAPGAWTTTLGGAETLVERGILSPEGVFCDPQIGCADRLVAVDLATARSRHFSQEFRVGSDFQGPLNFSLGANFLRYDTEDKYYVFINSLSLIAAASTGFPPTPYTGMRTDNYDCLLYGLVGPDPSVLQGVGYCTYIDPNPIHSLNDLGHNYFLSKNPYKLISYAVFGELYYQIAESLKVTGGLRWTVDKKEAPRIPSWVLASRTAGYPVAEVIEQEWREPTGRLAIDWKPDLSFTDETLLYGSLARGYKAGGANPPAAGIVAYCENCGGNELVGEAAIADSATHPKTFDPEFVTALEVGAKNTLLDGRLTLNTAAFHYDYKGYQISQIVDRAAVNHNFDATVWGVEIEADWRPFENLRLGFKGGYEHTRVADGEKAIDLMDRTAGDPNWVVVRPFPTYTSNCILPTELFVGTNAPDPYLVNIGGKGGGYPGPCELAYVLGYDPITVAPYADLTNVANPVLGEANTYFLHPGYAGWDPSAAPNNGEGIYKDLSGKELPNAPDFTATVTVDYTLPLPKSWLMTLHTDLYYQSEAWTRIFNTEGYDKLKAYTNVNLAAIFTNEDAGWKVMAYVKNVFDRDAITGAFLNSDDTGLTTNVFMTEPRLYGLRVTKEWNGGPWWTGADPSHTGPYPLTIELGGQVQRHRVPYETLGAEFADLFSDNSNPLASQHRDFDRGDGREVRLTFRPGGDWSVSTGVRYGRTNTGTTRTHDQEVGDTGCAVGYPFDVTYFCTPEYQEGEFLKYAQNWVDTTARSREEHTIIDFTLGHDVGLGLPFESAVAAGVRHATFGSTTNVSMRGVANWDIPEYWTAFKYTATADQYKTSIAADREFKGFGPALSWAAAQNLLGTDDTGHLKLDWGLTGGVLFGKQKTSISGSHEASDFYGRYIETIAPRFENSVVTPINIPRSQSVTVPFVDLDLGLAYEVGRVKVGAGYRWERYFDVLDVGYDEHKDADRTIDGPYFKIAVGFGG